MQYTTEILLNLPRARVVELFEDPENLARWQPGFQGIEHLGGTPGQPGAQSRLRYQNGKRTVSMTETIVENKLPDYMVTTYEAGAVRNTQRNYFQEEGPEKTRWISESEFQFGSLPMKVLGWVLPNAFKKQSRKNLESFKKFAESRG